MSGIWSISDIWIILRLQTLALERDVIIQGILPDHGIMIRNLPVMVQNFIIIRRWGHEAPTPGYLHILLLLTLVVIWIRGQFPVSHLRR
jgi:hypothetical protein